MAFLHEQCSLSTLDRKRQAKCKTRCEHCVDSGASVCFSSSSSAFLGLLTLDELHLKPVQHRYPMAVTHHYSTWFPYHSFTLFIFSSPLGKIIFHLPSLISKLLHFCLLPNISLMIQLFLSTFLHVHFFCLCCRFCLFFLPP